MSTTTQVGDAINLKKNVSESPVKRTFAKIRHPVRAQIPGKNAEKAQDNALDEEEEQHITTEQYAGSLGRGVLKEMLHYVGSDEGEESLEKVFVTMVNVANQLLLSDELRNTSRTAGQEIVTGASEVLAMTLVPQWKKVPKAFAAPILLVVSMFGGLFMLGLLLALWRFAIFGLH